MAADLVIRSNRGSGWRPADGEGGKPSAIFLLHGWGANHEVWSPLTDLLGGTSGLWVAPDLAGHGQSPWTGAYSLADHAADVALLVEAYGCADDFVVVGHSMGGAIALAMASGLHGPVPKRVLAFGIKTAWTADELSWLDGQAASPVRYFATMEEAMAKYLKVSGLTGLAEPWSRMAKRGVAQDRGRNDWRLATDPATARVGSPDMARLLGDAACPVRFAAGELDKVSPVEDLRHWVADTYVFPRLRHNAMVENPAAFQAWVERECLSAN